MYHFHLFGKNTYLKFSGGYNYNYYDYCMKSKS